MSMGSGSTGSSGGGKTAGSGSSQTASSAGGNQIDPTKMIQVALQTAQAIKGIVSKQA